MAASPAASPPVNASSEPVSATTAVFNTDAVRSRSIVTSATEPGGAMVDVTVVLTVDDGATELDGVVELDGVDVTVVLGAVVVFSQPVFDGDASAQGSPVCAPAVIGSAAAPATITVAARNRRGPTVGVFILCAFPLRGLCASSSVLMSDGTDETMGLSIPFRGANLPSGGLDRNHRLARLLSMTNARVSQASLPW